MAATTRALQISEDAWKGNSEFTVAICFGFLA
jgi:hypothetical protein